MNTITTYDDLIIIITDGNPKIIKEYLKKEFVTILHSKITVIVKAIPKMNLSTVRVIQKNLLKGCTSSSNTNNLHRIIATCCKRYEHDRKISFIINTDVYQRFRIFDKWQEKALHEAALSSNDNAYEIFLIRCALMIAELGINADIIQEIAMRNIHSHRKSVDRVTWILDEIYKYNQYLYDVINFERRMLSTVHAHCMNLIESLEDK